MNYACPCLHTTPCHPDCTCVRPHSSRGCERCCTYGSPDQRRIKAEWLVARVTNHARLVAACRKLGVTAPGDLRHWSTIPDVIAEFDAALAACEVGQ